MSKPQGVCTPAQVLHLQIDGWGVKAVFNIWSETHFSSYAKKIWRNITPMMPMKTITAGWWQNGIWRLNPKGDKSEWLEELETEIRYETRNLLISKQGIHDKEQDEKQISKRQQTTQIWWQTKHPGKWLCCLKEIQINLNCTHERKIQTESRWGTFPRRKKTNKSTLSGFHFLLHVTSRNSRASQSCRLSRSAPLIPSTLSCSWQSPQLWSIRVP